MSAKQNVASGLQDRFLNQIRKTRTPAIIYLSNGFQIKNATIVGFDQFVLLLMVEEKQMLVYKHAISSITPAQPIELLQENEEI